MALACAAPGPAHAETTVAPAADAYVAAATPATNYGSVTSLRTDGSPIERTYLRFDLSGLAAPPPSAALRIYAGSGNPTAFQVRGVARQAWTESGLTYANAPAVGAIVATSGRVTAGGWYEIDISALARAGGVVDIAITTAGSKATLLGSRESSHAPQLVIPAGPSPSPFVVRPDGAAWRVASATTGAAYTGTLALAVESAVDELNRHGGGVVRFPAGTYDLGTTHFELNDLVGITFEGAGADTTVIRNATDEAADTEPFDVVRAQGTVIRDMTVYAGGAARTTSDALDFDAGNDTLIERVKITGSRSRGIVFDGKDVMGGIPLTADRNTIRDCVISGVPGDGIQLLASRQNRIERCTISDTGRSGVRLVLSSASAGQPHKQPSDNVVSANVIRQAGEAGIDIWSGDRNTIVGNTVLDSSDDFTGHDGIRISSIDAVPCDDNVVRSNTATDDQAVKTQRYGLRIGAAVCHRTSVAGNALAGNLTGPILDLGTGTRYGATFRPVADAQVSEAAPTVNYGKATTLRADGSPLVRSVLRFSRTGMPATVARATLRLYANSGSTTGHEIRSLAAAAWDEATVTWLTGPGIGPILARSGAFAGGRWVDCDVTSLVRGTGPLEFAVTTPASTAIGYGSRESATPPELVVEPGA